MNRYSILFDGVDDRVTTATTLPPGGACFSFWAKSSDTGQNKGVFGCGGTSSGAFHVNWGGGFRPLLYLGTGRYQFWANIPAQDDGNWHHWVVWADFVDTRNCTLYVDGALIAEGSNQNTGSFDARGAITIGSDAATGGNSYTGNLDEFAIFNSELDSDQITAIYNGGVPTDLTGMSGLIGYFRMGDPNGQATYPYITDYSGGTKGTMINFTSAAAIVTDVPT